MQAKKICVLTTKESRAKGRFGTSIMPPPPTPVAWGGGSVVVDLMFDVLLIGCGGPGFGSCVQLFIWILVFIIMF